MDEADDVIKGWKSRPRQGPWADSFDAWLASIGARVADSPEKYPEFKAFLQSAYAFRSQFSSFIGRLEWCADSVISSKELGTLFGISDRHIRRVLADSPLEYGPSGGRNPVLFNRLKAVDFLRETLGKEPVFTDDPPPPQSYSEWFVSQGMKGVTPHHHKKSA